MKKNIIRKWSQQVSENSHALFLKKGIFTWHSARKIAKSLQNSALKSKARKGIPFQSAMSMLNFYINRAGKKLSRERFHTLSKVKQELRKVFKRK